MKSWMLSPGNEWSCNKRILIFSLGEKMNLNQETPRVDKKRSGLEGGSGYIISSEQEGLAKNWLGGGGEGVPREESLFFHSGTCKCNKIHWGIRSTQTPTAWYKLHQCMHLRARELAFLLCRHGCILWGTGKFFLKSFNMLYYNCCLCFLSLFMAPLVPRSWRFVVVVFSFFLHLYF